MNVRCTLKKNSDFRRLYTKGKSSITRCLVVYCRRNGKSVNRLGYTVTPKLGHAVVRNRVRRRLREIYRLNSPALKTGWDIVVVARTRCVSSSYAEMNAAFTEACEKLNLMEKRL